MIVANKVAFTYFFMIDAPKSTEIGSAALIMTKVMSIVRCGHMHAKTYIELLHQDRRAKENGTRPICRV